ncbi:phage terminase small subunit [Paenibacillus taichungensis]|uniref:phage terminase small subunit n=1 Tax=Paenibacillus taichungensis TaxID=484184 RepID=UPI0038107938
MDWTAIREEYESTDISLQDLANKYDVKYPTIKSRKQRQSWSKDAPKDASTKTQGALSKAMKGNRNAAGHGAPKGNKNAKGNKGGNGGPYGNEKAVTHGFFRKYFPADTIEIMEQIEKRSPLDMLWDQIMIQYTAIIRAQQIMYVEDKNDLTKVLKKEKPGMFGDEKEWEFQFAWDRQATFLNAQSRAMSTLQSLIKQYEDMCRQGTADEEQQLRISKLKAEVSALDKERMAETVVFKDDLHE